MEFLLAVLVFVLFLYAAKQSNRITALERALGSAHHLMHSLGHRLSVLEAWSYRPREAHAAPAEAVSHAAAVAPAFEPMPHPAAPPLWSGSVADYRHDATRPRPRPVEERTHPVASDDVAAKASVDVQAAPAEEQTKEAAPAEAPRADWERWIGVRGAAALGAAILVIALFYFLRYSIDAGWLSVGMRVALGAACSVACGVVAQTRLRASQPVLASWLTGACFAGLFACVWAAQYVAGVLGAVPAFVLVIVIAATCIAAAIKDDAMPIALLGLTGGFAAPMSLSLDPSRPYAIVVYLALLDAAMIALALKKRWWALAVLSMLATAAYQAMWLGGGAAAPVALQVSVLVVFAAIFGAMPALAPASIAATEKEPDGLALLTRFGAVVVPYVFSLRLASDPNIAARPAPIAITILVLTVLAIVLARRFGTRSLAAVPVAGNGLALLAWLLTAQARLSSTTFVVVALVAAAPYAVTALVRRGEVLPGAPWAAGTTLALFTLAPVFAPRGLAASVCGVVLLVGVSIASGVVRQRATLVRHALLAGAGSLGLLAAVAAHGSAGSSLGPLSVLAAGALMCAGALAYGTAREAVREGLLHGARDASVVLVLGAIAVATRVDLAPFAVLVGILSVVGIASGRDRQSYPLFGVVWAAALAVHGVADTEPPTSEVVAIAAASFALFAALPLLARAQLAHDSTPHGQAVGLVAFAGAILPYGFGLRDLDAGLVAGVVFLVASCLTVAWHRNEHREDAAVSLGSVALCASLVFAALSFEAEHRIWTLAVIGLGFVAAARGLGHRWFATAGLGLLLLATGSAPPFGVEVPSSRCDADPQLGHAGVSGRRGMRRRSLCAAPKGRRREDRRGPGAGDLLRVVERLRVRRLRHRRLPLPVRDRVAGEGSLDLGGVGRLGHRRPLRRDGQGRGRPALDEPGPGPRDRGQGLLGRPLEPARPLPGRGAPRARGVAARHLVLLPAVRFSQTHRAHSGGVTNGL